MDIKHEAVSKLKRIAEDLGHVPTRDEARVLGLSTKLLESFGLYSELLKAAGMQREDSKKKTKEIITQAFTRDINEIVKPSLEMSRHDFPKFKRTIVLGDVHFPFASMSSLMTVYSVLDQIKDIETVIQMGDLYDMFSFSKFPRSHMVIRPDEEINLARTMADEFWKSIRRMCPKADLVQITGNHDARPYKRVLESAPELEALLNFKPLFEFDGVQTLHDPRVPFVQDGISFTHGFSQPGTHRSKFQTHVVHGHTHRGGLFYSKNPTTNKFLFELDVGYLGDPSAKAFNYTPVKELKWSHGLGFISEYGPHWIPFE